jgi:fructose-1,6-bisphosphatase/inositol monophosphatase family enzyme
MEAKLAEIVTTVGVGLVKKKELLAKGGRWKGEQLKTEADLFAHKMLTILLNKINKLPIISEEGILTNLNPRPDKYWLIDPLDGTRSYVDGYKGWVTQVSLIEYSKVIYAAIYAPELDLLYLANRNHGSYLNGKKLKVNNDIPNGVTLIDNYPNPRGIAKKIMTEVPCNKYVESGSISLKICRIADGTSDLFVKDVIVRDWDVAAPMLVLEEAGGVLKKRNGSEFLLDGQFDKVGLIASNSKIINNIAKGILDL